MRLPIIQGIVRRQLLVNYRVDPDVMRDILPEPFEPKLQQGWAVAGICLIRLERIRPRNVLLPHGFASESAAHRVAVRLPDRSGTREGVFVQRRDTDSWLNHLAGGRIFPGAHRRARFDVRDDGLEIRLIMNSVDGEVRVEIDARAVTALPGGSIFASVQQASEFFEPGSVGYPKAGRARLFDGVTLRTDRWAVQPLVVREVRSSVFDDESRFPSGSIEFDHALVMRDVEHEWHPAPDLDAERVTV